MSKAVPPCFLCEGPASQILRVVDPSRNAEGDCPVCETCYYCACVGDDQAVAHLWSAMREGQSAGYTDAGLVHEVWKELKGRGGMAAVGWATWAVPTSPDDPIEGAFLLAALPNPTMPSLPPIWCRSRMPLYPAMLRAAQGALPSYEMPAGTTWDASGRFFLAPVPEGNELAPEKSRAVLDAVMALRVEHYGDRDFFALLANEGTNAGYEIIRRFLL